VSAPHLLAVNWRDPAHPEAGGAELHLLEILKRAVARGFRVTWLASGFAGAAAEAERDGIRIVRRGAWWNFNFVLPSVLRREFREPPPDLLVEDVNKVPSFTPWFTRAPVSVVVPHLFGTTAFHETAWPLAAYVVTLESLVPRVYRRSPFVVISESTRDDLARRGVPRQQVTVVHCGLDHETFRPDPGQPKAARPTVVFVGRLRRYKGLDLVLRALPAVRERVPGTRLIVVGDGPHRPALERLTRELRLNDAVEFTGFVPSGERVRRLREAHVAVQPSPKEGWGLTVVEANACGTAVVASRSPGLRDSVKDGVSGLLVPHGDVPVLAETLARVLADPELRARLERGGREWAARFTWEECADRSLEVLLGPLASVRVADVAEGAHGHA
jgi:glycosyltransferase involved in cell wall biosynthesis